MYVDNALGGGYPVGAVVEIVSDQGVGKSTKCLHIARNSYEKFPDKDVVYVDAEHDLDSNYVDTILGEYSKRMNISQPDTAEDTFKIIEKVIRLGNVSTIILDSIAHIIPESELTGDDRQVAAQAKIISEKMPKLKILCKEAGVLFIILNQFRAAGIGEYGNRKKKKHFGGFALPYLVGIQIEMWRSGFLTINNDTPYGQIVHMKIIKNKYHVPYKEAEFYLVYGQGISMYDEVLDMSVDIGEIKKAGSWFSLNDGTKLGQGRSNVINFLKENDDLYKDLLEKSRQAI